MFCFIVGQGEVSLKQAFRRPEEVHMVVCDLTYKAVRYRTVQLSSYNSLVLSLTQNAAPAQRSVEERASFCVSSTLQEHSCAVYGFGQSDYLFNMGP